MAVKYLAFLLLKVVVDEEADPVSQELSKASAKLWFAIFKDVFFALSK